MVNIQNGLLSVIVPSYNEEACIEIAYDRIHQLLKNENIEHRIIFIDDGSSDQTYAKIKLLSQKSDCVSGVHFSRNFGKESAIYAGLNYAYQIASACAVVIDCDLQHPPEKIIQMYRLWQNGYEVVEGIKVDRGEESLLHRLSANFFYDIISKATQINMQRSSDFKLLDKKAMVALLNIKENRAFFRALSSWIGFKTTRIEYEVREREAGESKWSIGSLIKYAIRNITSFSTSPMQLVTVLGVLVCALSIVLGIISLVQKITGQALEGFTTVIILQLSTSSTIMISIGIVGYYISRIYEEVKNRPKYIISEICGDNNAKKTD